MGTMGMLGSASFSWASFCSFGFQFSSFKFCSFL